MWVRPFVCMSFATMRLLVKATVAWRSYQVLTMTPGVLTLHSSEISLFLKRTCIRLLYLAAVQEAGIEARGPRLRKDCEIRVGECPPTTDLILCKYLDANSGTDHGRRRQISDTAKSKASRSHTFETKYTCSSRGDAGHQCLIWSLSNNPCTIW